MSIVHVEQLISTDDPVVISHVFLFTHSFNIPHYVSLLQCSSLELQSPQVKLLAVFQEDLVNGSSIPSIQVASMAVGSSAFEIGTASTKPNK